MKYPTKIGTEIVKRHPDYGYTVRVTLSQKIIEKMEPDRESPRGKEPVMGVISVDSTATESTFSKAMDEAVEQAWEKLEKAFLDLPRKKRYLNL